MGLDTTHGAWNGPYSSFNRWRTILAEEIGLTLNEMAGFGGEKEWDANHDLTPLLYHSDCDGELTVDECIKVRRGLVEILNKYPELLDSDDFNNETRWFIYKLHNFIAGCELAIEGNESIKFQ